MFINDALHVVTAIPLLIVLSCFLFFISMFRKWPILGTLQKWDH